jgi:hypothetical protein
MQEIYLLAAVVILCILLIIFAKYTKEGFEQKVTTHDGLDNKHFQKYNNIGSALIAKGHENVMGKNTMGLFGNIITNIDNTGNTNQYVDNPYPLEGDKTGLYANIKKCEKVTTTDCSAFDDPFFTENCSLCLDIGKNSEDKNATGGLSLIPQDKKYFRDNKRGNGIPDYVPTVGFCPAKKLVSNKDECLRMKKQIECTKNTTFDSPKGCSMCYDDTSYHIVDPTGQPGLLVGSGVLYILGSGILTYYEMGQDNKRKTNLSRLTNPLRIELMGKEMTNITLELKRLPVAVPYDDTVTYEVDDAVFYKGVVYNMVEGANQPGFAPDRIEDKLWVEYMKEEDYIEPPPAYIAGVLTGATGNSGTFTFDLFRLILTDTVSGRKPRTGGTVKVKPGDADEVDATKMIPVYGKNIMKMIAVSPFTFVDTTTDEAATCPTSPFVTKQSSAEFLQADPCYKKGSGPGKFTLECLQNTFLTSGCQESGKGYPKSPKEASNVMFDEDGSALSLSKIADKMYSYAVMTSTGIGVDGKKLNIKDWSSASVFCTGKAITSPCDVENKDSGPLSTECIIYLWDNQGANNELGTSYSSSIARSLFAQGTTPRFCNRNGTLSPVGINGKNNSAVINFWKRQGGVNAIKKAMMQIHSDANSSLLPENVKAQKITQCYGLIPGSRPSFTSNYISDTTVTFAPPPPPPPVPVIACVGGISYTKLGEFKLAFLNEQPCDYVNRTGDNYKKGWIFINNKSDWTKITEGFRNETWAHVHVSTKDMNGVKVVDIVNNTARKLNIPERITQQAPPYINYYIKLKSSDKSSIILNKCGHMANLWCGSVAAIIGMFEGNNWTRNSDPTYKQYVVDMLTGGSQRPVGVPLMGDTDGGDANVYELYFAITTDTGCVTSSDNSSPPPPPSYTAPAVMRDGPGWNF